MTKSILFVGECMMEIRKGPGASIEHSFAGDTYNSAVYAKRWNPDHRIAFFSALGDDPISEMMLISWKSEGIDSALVCKSNHRVPGIYAISTDSQGERKFFYWRKNSAATEMLELLEQQGGAASIPDFNCVYFSGISLGILSDDDKERLLNLMRELRRRGASVAFDPNYRESLWLNEKHARAWILRAYQCCDLAFPGLDEHKLLFAHQTASELGQFLNGLGVKEIVVKSGLDGVYVFSHNQLLYHKPFQAAPTQVDATAAGDSFAGTYLAERITGRTVNDAVDAASGVAKMVVQHSGAIVGR